MGSIVEPGLRFPPGFLWGAATAAYQVEGGIEANDWHAFTTSPAVRRRVRRLTAMAGAPAELGPAGPAAGHRDLAQLRADLDAARSLGLNAYRFSLEWSRLQPRPASALEPTAVRYYHGVLDACRAAGLTPIVTLNHFTLPRWVLEPPGRSLPLADPRFRQSLRGWESEATVAAFATFVRAVAEAFTGRVRYWLALNEPAGAVALGYIAGVWPPGFVLRTRRARLAMANLARAHERAYVELKTADVHCQVSFAQAVLEVRPSVRPLSAGAAERFDAFLNRWFLDAVAKQATLDFVALNYYRSVAIRSHPLTAAFARPIGGSFENDLRGSREPHGLLNDLGWEIAPAGLGRALRRVHREYGLPVMVTENGIAEREDCNRAPFIVAHLDELLRARNDGVDVRGYLHWSLIDNYEWHEGYRPAARFGLLSASRELRGGALALHSVVAHGATDRARRGFGSFAADGRRVSAPERSPGALWIGHWADGRAFELYLLDGLTGLLLDQTWHALADVRWDASTRTLHFQHGGTQHRALAGGTRLTGTGWVAERAPHFGLWTADGTPSHVFLGRSSAKALFDAWRPLAVRWSGPELTLRGEGVLATGVPSEGELLGTVTPPDGATRPWRAHRAPTGLPF